MSERWAVYGGDKRQTVGARMRCGLANFRKFFGADIKWSFPQSEEFLSETQPMLWRDWREWLMDGQAVFLWRTEQPMYNPTVDHRHRTHYRCIKTIIGIECTTGVLSETMICIECTTGVLRRCRCLVVDKNSSRVWAKRLTLIMIFWSLKSIWDEENSL